MNVQSSNNRNQIWRNRRCCKYTLKQLFFLWAGIIELILWGLVSASFLFIKRSYGDPTSVRLGGKLLLHLCDFANYSVFSRSPSQQNSAISYTFPYPLVTVCCFQYWCQAIHCVPAPASCVSVALTSFRLLAYTYICPSLAVQPA